jgi:hypothetical protein
MWPTGDQPKGAEGRQSVGREQILSIPWTGREYWGRAVLTGCAEIDQGWVSLTARA